MGIDHATAKVLNAANGIKISSVAYETEESASEESTARAFHLGILSFAAI
jgi:hypothetical protein